MKQDYFQALPFVVKYLRLSQNKCNETAATQMQRVTAADPSGDQVMQAKICKQNTQQERSRFHPPFSLMGLNWSDLILQSPEVFLSKYHTHLPPICTGSIVICDNTQRPLVCSS